jgi:hypothetical protein
MPATAPRRARAQRETGAMTDQQRTQAIRTHVTAAGERARARHPWLAHQNLIGLSIQLGSVAGIIACSVLYMQGSLPAWVTILAVALLASLTHEIEHDLIHQMYFKGNPFMQNLLLLLGWLARPSTVNPWLRRDLHFHHHKRSGSASDLEERGITNGETWGLKRLVMLADGKLAIMLRLPTMRRAMRTYIREAVKPTSRMAWLNAARKNATSYWPVGTVFWACWHAFVVYHVVDLGARALGHPISWNSHIQAAMPMLNAFAVCLMIPNIIRSFCLHFISSNMHYYGDIESSNVMQQTQVFNHPVFWPMQLMCFNFGATHAIHHFVVGQPFYLRQMIAPEAHDIMRRMGVRFNDLGTFRRANRMHEQPVVAKAQLN